MSDIENNLNHKQALATNPEATIWVSANAGSGKTYVLSRRVIRLLLEGAKPSELLCLTFTKAAAAEMANRVFDILSSWAMMDDAALCHAITELNGSAPSPEQVLNARRLFAIALDTPGGLRIQTIHAFCEALLHQFPLEANIPGHFEMMDDLEQSNLLDEAYRKIIITSANTSQINQDSIKHIDQLKKSLEKIQDHATDTAIEKAIAQLIQDREQFTNWIIQSGKSNAKLAFQYYCEEFGFERFENSAELYKKFPPYGAYSYKELDQLIELANAKTTNSFIKLAENLSKLKNSINPVEAFEIRQKIFLTKTLTPRKSLVSKAFLKDEPEQQFLFEKEQVLLLEQTEQLKRTEVLNASEAIFTIAEAILIEYSNLKKRQGLLDFNDLISKTAHLLNRNEIAAWVQYKLDNGISHVLVDEAQDTSPLQWQVIEAITSEFYAGKGARETIRTLFVVGDEKQSIYSFQGADPQEFRRQYNRIMGQAKNANLNHERIELNLSFRSTEEVLSAVDQVFSVAENAKGLGLPDRQQTHSANRIADQGEVIIWPYARQPEKIDKSDWRAPVDAVLPTSAEAKLADRIASTIDKWVGKEKLPGRDRYIRYGDILILVRKRDRFVSAMNRALKQKNLNSAGADRLKLTEHIAIEDMLAIGRFATSPFDDLALAGIMKSPVFGFTDNELFAIAHYRKDKTLFEAVEDFEQTQKYGDNNPSPEKLDHAQKLLNWMIVQAQALPVYEFYSRLMARSRIKHLYFNTLGNEVEEVLDGFLQAAINYDNKTGLGLQSFVEWMACSEPELKRDVDMSSDEIRVITTHSSKGLEAPIVFFVDPFTKPFYTKHAPAIIYLEKNNINHLPLWISKKEVRIQESVPVFDRIEALAEEEYRRLLYVGMTRAADRLIICGYGPETPPQHNHWYSMIEKAMALPPVNTNQNGRLELEYNDQKQVIASYWRIDNRFRKEKPLTVQSDISAPRNEESPNWFSPANSSPIFPKPLSPSGVLDMLNITPDREPITSYNDSKGIDRGNAVHQLLQILPDVDKDLRNDVIEKFFSTNPIAFEAQEQKTIENAVVSLLENQYFQDFLGPNSKAEVELVGKLKIANQQHLVRGKIDRLIIEENSVKILDYKTNRSIPDNPDHIPEEYLAQMALYRALVASIYPKKVIESIIIWVMNSSIMDIPDDLLTSQLEKLNNS